MFKKVGSFLWKNLVWDKDASLASNLFWTGVTAVSLVGAIPTGGASVAGAVALRGAARAGIRAGVKVVTREAAETGVRVATRTAGREAAEGGIRGGIRQIFRRGGVADDIAIRGMVYADRARAVGSAVMRPFTRATFQHNVPGQGLMNITRTQARALRAAGKGDQVIEGVRQFSKLRTGAVAAGALAVNGLTDGAISDTGMYLIKNVGGGAITFIGGAIASGAAEVAESVDQQLMDGQGKHWLESAMGGEPAPFVDEDGRLFSTTDYRTIYDGMSEEERAGIMTPDEYDRQHQTLMQQQQARLEGRDPAAAPGTTPGISDEFNDLRAIGTANLGQLRGSQLSAAFDRAKQAVDSGRLKLGFVNGIMFSLISGLAGMFNNSSSGIGSWLGDAFRKFALSLAKDEVVSQFGDRFGLRQGQPAPAMAGASP